MRCLVFLAIVASSACAVTGPPDACPCDCPNVDDEGDLCDFLGKQWAKVTASHEQMVRYSDVLKLSAVFFADIQKPIAEVVNALVERHVNSVMKRADLGTPSGNPGDSTQQLEEGLEGTRDYLTHVFIAMRNSNLEMKKKLEEVGKLSPRLKELEDNFALYKEITEIKKKLGNLAPDFNGTKIKDAPTAVNGGKCEDDAYPAYCAHIVDEKYCTNEYYRRICCVSCAKAGQLPPD